MKDYLNILIFSFCLLLSNTVSTLGASAEKSVIRVNTTMQAFNLIQPWEKGAATSRLGLGAVLPDNKVLVTAQMVTDATYIELEKPDSSEKTPAKVITVDYEANLQFLSLPTMMLFWQTENPFKSTRKYLRPINLRRGNLKVTEHLSRLRLQYQKQKYGNLFWIHQNFSNSSQWTCAIPRRQLYSTSR